MDRVPNSVPVRLKAMAGGDHPDPDLLTALAEQALPERERAQVLLHLSRCAQCREVLALAIPPVPAQASLSLDTNRRSWFHGSSLRWAAVAACVVIVGSAVMLKRDAMMTRTAQTATIESDAKAGPMMDERAVHALPAAPESEDRQAYSSRLAAKPQPPSQDKELKQALRVNQEGVPKARRDVGGLSNQPSAPAAGAVAAGGSMVESRNASIPAHAMVPAQLAPMDGARGGLVEKPALPPMEGLKNRPLKGRNLSQLTDAAPGVTNETVQVEAATPLVQTDANTDADRLKREAPGKAKAPGALTKLDRLEAAEPLGAMQGAGSAQEAVAKKVTRERAAYVNSPLSRWTISSDGQLQHSVDSGKTWQPVTITANATFRALSANGPDVWVGGTAGLLYHSTDAGSHWVQIRPAEDGGSLTGDIAAIEFTDIREGKVTTANGEVWLTSDGGQSWHKQP